jgi:methyltransferase-like protein/2-polyprenyl-3-methyl-5-hydroxy-6-metoxy-1,4-benzoquinol methylase
LPRRETHPAHIAAICALFGIKTAAVDNCKVLELGCGTGSNLIPMASEYPSSSFLGIDLSTVQIQEGKKIVAELALKNIQLSAQSIKDFRKSKDKYDYIICHGVFSWVDHNVQTQIMKIFSDHLTDNGIAYLSYNTLPGWRMQGAIREMMQYHTAFIEDPAEKVTQAKALLHFLSKSQLNKSTPYSIFIEQCLDELKKAPDYYVFHEYLEEQNEAFYFHQIIDRAEKHSLTYVADVHFGLMGSADLTEETKQTLEELKTDRVRYEQYLDFLRNRKLRESLFCTQKNTPYFPANSQPIEQLYCAAALESKSAILNLSNSQLEVFTHRNGGEIKSDTPIVKAALVALSQAWPESVAFSNLARAACIAIGIEFDSDQGAQAKSELMSSFLSYAEANLINFTATPTLCIRAISDYPETSALARYQALRQEYITSLRHTAVKLESTSRQILALLDGKHSQADLREALMNLHANGELVIEGTLINSDSSFLKNTLDQLIQQILELLAKQGFLKYLPTPK